MTESLIPSGKYIQKNLTFVARNQTWLRHHFRQILYVARKGFDQSGDVAMSGTWHVNDLTGVVR